MIYSFSIDNIYSSISRDLAARNVLLDKDYEAVVADFGLSRVLNPNTGSNPDSQKSSIGTTKSDTGPIKWMAPESLTKKQYSTKSDVWSFGVTLYEIMARNEPWPGNFTIDIRYPSIPLFSEGYIYISYNSLYLA